MSDMQLYLGLDLSPEYTQLSYYNMDTREPESVYHKEAKDTYMLPNVMFYSAYHKKTDDVQNGCYRFVDLSGWCVGAKASAYRFEENGTIIDNVYQRVMRDEHIDVDGRVYTARELLIKLMVLHIKQFTDDIGPFVIKKLTVTVADTDARLIQAVRGLGTALKLTNEQFNIVSHMDSGLCYIFAQPEPLRNNSVGLYDFGRDGLEYYRIDLTRKYPLIVSVWHKSYKDKLSLKRFGRNYEDMDETFAEIVRETVSQVFISSAFLTGVGFVDDWMKQSAAVLCQGRRVFVGQNIYTKGACYRSLGGVYTEALSRYFIDTEQTVKTNIGINLMDEKRTFWPVAFGGGEWFNTRGRAEFFLDQTYRLQIVYQDILTEDKWSETIEIHGLPARPNKTTKLSMEVEYSGAEKGAIVIRDLGFGSLYPTTNKIYRKEFDISSIRRKNERRQELEKRQEQEKLAEGDTDELKGTTPTDESYETSVRQDGVDGLQSDAGEQVYGGHGDDMSGADSVSGETDAEEYVGELSESGLEASDVEDDETVGEEYGEEQAADETPDEEPDEASDGETFEMPDNPDAEDEDTL